jgi:hypothetical protein
VPSEGPVASEPVSSDPVSSTESAPAAPLVVPGVAPRVTRRQARQLRRRRRRRRLGAAGVAIVVVAVAVVAAVVAFGVHHVVTNPSTPKRHQTTVLLQLQQAGGHDAAASVLLAHDSGATEGVELLVPSRLIANVCGFGSEPFGTVLGQPNGVTVSRQTLSSILDGVSVDGSWVLDPQQLAQLVDKVGGVDVAVDVNVVQHTSHGDVLAIPKGDRQLSGVQAVQFATYSASAGEDASAQLDRTRRVLEALVRKLPASTAEVTADIRSLGSSAQPTIGAARLAAVLVGLKADQAKSGGLYPSDFPVTPIDSGGAPAYGVDDQKVTQLVDQRLAASKPASSGSQVSVELLNGIGTPGLVATACPKLAAHGLVFAGSGNADTFTNPHSQVQVGSDSQAALGQQVAKALGLPTSDVRVQQFGQSVADAVVILGKDYPH